MSNNRVIKLMIQNAQNKLINIHLILKVITNFSGGNLERALTTGLSLQRLGLIAHQLERHHISNIVS